MNHDVFLDGKASEGEDCRQDIAEGKVSMGPPSIVAHTVLWLAHCETQINSEISSTSSVKVAHMGFVVAEGSFDPHHTLEALAGHEAQIRELASNLKPEKPHNYAGFRDR